MVLKSSTFHFLNSCYYSESPSDFTALMLESVEFGECETRRCVNITIVDDLVLEMEESFIVVLNRTSQLDSRISLEPTTAEIVIVDDDGRLMQEHVCSYHNIQEH